MMGSAAGFDPNYRRRNLLEKPDHLLAPQLFAQNHRLGRIHPVKLEEAFRRIHPNSANLFHRRSPFSEICNDLILAHAMPSTPSRRLTANYIAAFFDSIDPPRTLALFKKTRRKGAQEGFSADLVKKRVKAARGG